jgi:hypothetical protein
MIRNLETIKRERERWNNIEAAATRLHSDLEVSEHMAQCVVTHHDDFSRVTVVRLTDGMTASERVEA